MRIKNILKRDFSNESASQIIFIMAFIVYSLISMTKNAYSASIASIIAEGTFTKSSAGVVNAGFYLLYGIGQIAGVGLVDRVSPVKLVYVTLFGTIAALIGMVVAKSFTAMLVIWSLCGLIQFGIWPAILRVIAEYMLPDHRKKALTAIAFSYCVGAVINYLMAAVVLSVSVWRTLFLVSAVMLVLSAVMWGATYKKLSPQLREIKLINREQGYIKANTKEKQKISWKLLLSSGIIILLIPAFLRSAMDNGVKAWVPTMIVDSYGVTAGFASVLTTVLLIVNLSGVFISNFIRSKVLKNATAGFGLVCLLAVPFTMLLLMIGKIPISVSVILLTVITTLVYAGAQFVNIIIPSYFAKYNMTGAVAAMLNGAASFGIVFANIIFGVLAQKYGWNTTIVFWVIMLSLAGVFCLITAPMWSKFIKKGEN